MTPDFKVIAAGVNITPQIKDRLLRLSVTDEAGTKADAVEIGLDDQGGLIGQPTPGAPMPVSLGYRETGLIPMGLFTSDEVTVSPPPATLIIRARAAGPGDTIKDRKTRGQDRTGVCHSAVGSRSRRDNRHWRSCRHYRPETCPGPENDRVICNDPDRTYRPDGRKRYQLSGPFGP